jgi:hypothetical protein
MDWVVRLGVWFKPALLESPQRVRAWFDQRITNGASKQELAVQNKVAPRSTDKQSSISLSVGDEQQRR